MLILFYLGREKQYFIRCSLTEGGMPEERDQSANWSLLEQCFEKYWLQQCSWQNCYATNGFRIPEVKPR